MMLPYSAVFIRSDYFGMKLNTIVIYSVIVMFSVCILLESTEAVVLFGASRVSIHQAPYMAVFKSDFSLLHYCGAAIVHHRFLLTAAHCYQAHILKYPYIIVGTDSLTKQGELHQIEEYFRHPLFNKSTIDYDIMVIKLKWRLSFNVDVQPIRMAKPGMEFQEGEVMEAIGFGSTKSGITSTKLLKVDLPYYNTDKCKIIYEHAERTLNITDRMLCAGGVDGKNTCKGDSGGPLVYRGTLVGITSFGAPHDKCAQKGEPGVFTRISAVRPFIDDVIRKNA